ncbi:helix-turn-helix domain-containing protein [Algoriphagus lutimaris]|uniref:helix-turn-helix domain-containing protein n=1 Tax=Algoriphagus lutimaris TaxID=613197 RepID=UPI001FB038E8|nr:AraC family transcriptional regulator [Algoriphagus lutimaris]
MLVEQEMNKLGFKDIKVELGLLDIKEDVSSKQLKTLSATLLLSGLEVLEDKKDIIVERIKNVIIEMIHYSEELPTENYSDFLSGKMKYDYKYISNLFSEKKGISIQQFIILNKIERVKELLLYGELNLSQISTKLHYSSIAHLSNQFKKVTGMTPSHFNKMKLKRNSNLEEL